MCKRKGVIMKLEILTGKKLTKQIYLQTWRLDNKVFEKKDQLTQQTALDWFEWSDRSTIVLYDCENNELLGYITPYLFNHRFASEYICSNKTYKEAIKKSCFVKPNKGVTADIYIFSTVVAEKYRDKRLSDVADKRFKDKSAFKILNEAFVDWICDIKKKGVSINYVFGEKVTEHGDKYLHSLGMQPCKVLENDVKFAKLFSPSMFNRCSNVSKLYDIYKDEDAQIPFDQSLLDGHEYLSIKNNVLYYNDMNLLEMVKKNKAPLEVAYTPMIPIKVNFLKDLFAKKIKEFGYKNCYKYAYATKANYYSEVVLSALQAADILETSSSYDIGIILFLAKKKIIKPGFTVICNGFKNERYLTHIRELLKLNIHVIPVIENERELKLLEQLKDYDIDVGVRYNSDFEARIIKNDFSHAEEFDNRFGFDKECLFKIAEQISKNKHMHLKLLHFHFGGTINNIDNYINGFANIMQVYCDLKKMYPSFEYFDFGGGVPVKYSLTYQFDYEQLVEKIIKTAKLMCDNNKTKHPILVGEHGRFTAADHSFYIYKIDFVKKTGGKAWYIINGSLMNMTPDVWGIQQDFTILPVNLYENKCIPVCLGGETCDPDDRYFLNEKNIKLFLPQIKDGQSLYVAIFSIGAYQEMISGVGGLHHCLIPEGNELVIYDEDGKHNYISTGSTTDTAKALDILDYDKPDYIKHFIK